MTAQEQHTMNRIAAATERIADVLETITPVQSSEYQHLYPYWKQPVTQSGQQATTKDPATL